MRAERPRGFILPTSLLVLTLLTVMLTAAFVLVSAEYRSTNNALAGTRALALAHAGLQTYFAANRSLDSTDGYDSVRYTWGNGYADVVARKMILATAGVTTWVVKSSATATDPIQSGEITARRVVGQMASLFSRGIPVRAGLVALNGVHVRGGSATHNPVDGDDNNPGGIGGCTPPVASDTFALSTVPGGYTYEIPDVVPGGRGVETMPNVATLYDSTHIDWPAIVAGDLTPDYVGVGGLPPPGGGVPWKIGYIVGDVTIPTVSPWPGWNPAVREGVLMVTGNVRMGNQSHWDGIILAGGTIQGVNAAAQWIIHGYAVSGLNCVLSAPPCTMPKDTLWRDNFPAAPYREIKWSWCWAHIGVNAMTVMRPIRNTFIDNWAAY